MKMMDKAGLASGMGVGLVLFFCVVRTPSHADELLLVPPELWPTNGLFYSFQNPDHPPLPQNILPELPLYWVEEDSFLIDDETVDYEVLKALWVEAFPQRSASSNESTSASSSTDCGELTVPVVTTTWSFWTNVWTNQYLMMPPVVGTNVVTNVSHEVSFSVQSVPTNTEVDVFGTFYWYAMTNLPSSFWHYLGRATNGQEFTVPHGSCPEGWYMAACTNDSDGDGLSDAYELLVSKTSPETNHSVNAIFDDGEIDNVLVNGLWQDWGNEQNTQFETTCVVAGSNIIVAWVDSNKGVYGHGSVADLTGYVPQFVGYAVSRDRGRTFEDMGEPPLSLLSTNLIDDGDAGDPAGLTHQKECLIFECTK